MYLLKFLCFECLACLYFFGKVPACRIFDIVLKSYVALFVAIIGINTVFSISSACYSEQQMTTPNYITKKEYYHFSFGASLPSSQEFSKKVIDRSNVPSTEMQIVRARAPHPPDALGLQNGVAG